MFFLLFQYMESVCIAYLENKECALENEQLVTMTCKNHSERQYEIFY